MELLSCSCNLFVWKSGPRIENFTTTQLSMKFKLHIFHKMTESNELSFLNYPSQSFNLIDILLIDKKMHLICLFGVIYAAKKQVFS